MPPQNSQPPLQQEKREQAAPPIPTVPVSNGNLSAPLARTTIVRENTNAVSLATVKTQGSSQSGETRQEVAKKKARSDPVIQKVVEMFKAEIKEVHLK
ncbi:MAG: hypothetical protein JOZ18_23230, partial [Chloroflexi bacterium]|nr:hypothetical protein [Chloroflexota bacterium]